ncbi:GMC oxidoreductase-domain-containing protein, partial [Mycena epipterygia]
GHTVQEGKTYCSFFLSLTHAFARGSVHIASSDPLTPPTINLGTLDNDLDLDILVQAVKFARRLVATDSMRKVIIEEVHPGPAVQTDEDIKDYVRKSISTVFHYSSTASMLPRNDGGVVDPSLKVYGTSNLRVIDTSIFPIQLSAHCQATVYAIAEKVMSFAFHRRRWLTTTGGRYYQSESLRVLNRRRDCL